MPKAPATILFGAAYYYEYQPTERLKEDLDLMVDAGFTVIRVGESVWSTWEPANGRFELDWLQPVLDGADEHGISVILGTPTYAVPPWLVRLYPEIAAERRTGDRIPWGARQEVDYSHAAFRFHAERVIRKIIARYADHPAIIGFQVDNEPGLELFHNESVFQAFVDWLREQYGTVERLNEEWGLVYWSHRLSTWADLWRPDGNAQPQYELAWRRFQARLTSEFIGWQAQIVREYASPDQFVTTCIAYDRPAFDDVELMTSLDITAGNAYYVMQDGLAVSPARTREQTWNTEGAWALFFTGDRMYSSSQGPFIVSETNATSIGASWDNRPAYKGQWRQAAWALIARGARMVEYWHWHTLHFGAETYWGGVLPHTGNPGRVYREVASLGRELQQAGPLVAGLVPDADVALLYSMPTRWLMQRYPALGKVDASPDPRAYQGLIEPFYRGALDAGLQVRLLHPEQFAGPDREGLEADDVAARHPILVASGFYVSTDEQIDWLHTYAAAGGHLILGPRTGYADHEARARRDVMPARLAEPAGAWYEEYSNLLEPVPVTALDDAWQLPAGAAATRWIDGLTVTDARPLARYDHPHFGQWPAVTTRSVGAGSITYVGTVPNAELAQAILRWASGNRPPWGYPVSASITSTSGVSADGRRLRFVHNWSWEATFLTAPVECRDILTGELLPKGSEISLGPWDVRVLVQSDQGCP